MEKYIFENINQVKTYLTSIGFTISGSKILWSYAESDTQCYFQIVNNIITFKRSDGQSAFEKDLVNFDYVETITVDDEPVQVERPLCAVITIPLQEHGMAIYMGMVVEGTTAQDIEISCSNKDTLMNNGLVVISPAEADGHWYYGWNDPTAGSEFYWSMDNGHGSYEYGENVTNVAPKDIYSLPGTISLTKTFLRTGHWSKNFRVEVAGDLTPPAFIFTLNGQKYIVFTNNTTKRAPAYKLPPEGTSQNLSTSTEEYSPLKTYVVGDYCIYEGYLYKCRTAIPTPEAFDSSKWIVTTVYNELIDAGNHIYGN